MKQETLTVIYGGAISSLAAEVPPRVDGCDDGCAPSPGRTPPRRRRAGGASAAMAGSPSTDLDRSSSPPCSPRPSLQEIISDTLNAGRDDRPAGEAGRRGLSPVLEAGLLPSPSMPATAAGAEHAPSPAESLATSSLHETYDLD